VDARIAEVAALEQRRAAPEFWDRAEDAQKSVASLKLAKRIVDEFAARDGALRSLAELVEMAEAEPDEALLTDLARELDRLEPQIAELEMKSLLSGEHDRLGALVNIHPGAGGTESQDWAEMLMRMYRAGVRPHQYRVTRSGLAGGRRGGHQDATLEIGRVRRLPEGRDGVHRLVRLSPYDANARRHFVNVGPCCR
jgi:peptide chain release factor 2